ncbi:MAG: hypothetical protein D6698_11895 [Gammaproteobacteria bacterium]|nr:MAG: hypothetical protein D6698_11895 [Gammaproteobacteria bacterium]
MNWKPSFSVFVMMAMAFTLLAACSQTAGPAAPIGDRATLERLAQSYEKLSVGLPMAADRLPEKERKDFTVRVFQDAGYDYGKTLQELVSGRHDVHDKLVRDMAELVNLPHRYLKWDDRVLTRLYSNEELDAIKRLHRMLNTAQ